MYLKQTKTQHSNSNKTKFEAHKTVGIVVHVQTYMFPLNK